MNHRLIIAYDGTPYRGWQIQGQAPTIQLHLESALATLWQQPIRVHGSGRTDTGVHARGQVAHFHAPEKFQRPERLRDALNAHLPKTIRIGSAAFVPSSFHSRFSARGKEYHYRLLHGGNESPFEVDYAWQLRRPLDIGSMREASRHLLGEHDFASFASNPGYGRESTVRTLYRIEFASRGNLLTLRFIGSGFLYRMVRNLTGALVRTGDGRLNPGDLGGILKQAKRAAAPPPAPACGLYLHRVYYRSPAGRKPSP
jgi:tRNA pseudouridine38-40 synthase